MLLLFMDMIDDEKDKQLFQTLYEENRQRMYQVAYQILQDNGLAEDAVQNAFFKLAEKFSSYQKEEKELLAHLCLVLVKSKALDLQKKQNRLPLLSFSETFFDTEFSATSDQPEEILLQKEAEQELYHTLSQTLSTLSEKEYHILSLRHYHQFKSSQIAKLLNMTENNVNVSLHRIYKKLRKELQSKQ